MLIVKEEQQKTVYIGTAKVGGYSEYKGHIPFCSCKSNLKYTGKGVILYCMAVQLTTLSTAVYTLL